MKRRILCILVMVAMVLAMTPNVGPLAVYADDGITGSGTAEDPYLISSEAGLRTFAGYAEESNYAGCAKLTEDITLTSPWTAIIPSSGYATEAFAGVFDGDGHTIKGLSINATTTNQGLFGVINGGTVKNLRVEGNVSSSKAYVGGIVGKLQQGTIENCSFAGTVSTSVTGSAGHVGGICGYAGNSATQTGTILCCVNRGTVSGGVAGGIMGYGKYATVTDSYNTGTVSGAYRSGGIAGQAQNNVTITNCYNIGENNGSSANKADIVDFLYSSAKLDNCWYLEKAFGSGTGTVTGGGLINKDSLLSDLKSASFAADENNINNGYPILFWEAGGTVVPQDPEIVITGNTNLYLPNSETDYPTTTLTATANHFDAAPEIVWSLTDGSDVIKFSDGDEPNTLKITPLKAGTAKVTAYASGTEVSTEAEIRVYPFITTVDWQGGNPAPGEEYSIVVSVYGGGEYDFDSYPPLPAISWKYYDDSGSPAGETAITGTGTKITVPAEALNKYLYASFMYNGQTKAPPRRIQVLNEVPVKAVEVEGEGVTEVNDKYEIKSGTLLTAVPLGEGGMTPTNVTYQWMEKNSAGEFEAIEGAISNKFTADDSVDSVGTVYRVTVSGASGSSATSKDIEITELSGKAEDELYLTEMLSHYNGLGVLTPVYGTDTNIAAVMQAKFEADSYTGITTEVKSVEKNFPSTGGEADIASDGAITYFYADPTVVWTAPYNNMPYAQFSVTFTVRRGEASQELTKTVNVYWNIDKLKAYLQTEILDKITWDTIKNENTVENEAKTDLALPIYPRTSDTRLIRLAWTSDNTDAVEVKDPAGTPDEVAYGDRIGEVKRGLEDKTANLTITVNYVKTNNKQEEDAIKELSKSFAVTVPKYTEEEIHQMILDDLEAKLNAGLENPGLRDFYIKEPIDPDAVIRDIQFPTTNDFKVDGKYQPVTITTDNPSVIDYPRDKDDPTKPLNNAARVYVYRPAPGEDPVTVTITVTITDKESGVYASKDISVTVLPLTHEELDEAAALMEQAVAGYWDGIKFENTDKGDIKSDLHPFYEVSKNSEGELEFQHDPLAAKGAGIVPATYVENPDGSNDGDYRRFNVSSNPCIENVTLSLIEPHPARTTKVTIDSYLSHGIYGEYYAKYMAEGKTEQAEMFRQFYRQHASVEVTVKGQEPEENIILRLSGDDRFDTSIAAAEHLKEKNGGSKFDNIIIVSGLDFPDALSATYLAYKKNAPILLVGVDAASIRKITDYANDNLAEGGTVYIAGGEAVVVPEVKNSLTGTVNRLSGEDRYGTNLAVLEEAGLTIDGDIADILIACGGNYADALSASALGKPILLVGKSMTDEQKAYLSSLMPEDTASYWSPRFDIIGGTGAVPEAVEDQLKELQLGSVERIYGEDRFETSSEIVGHFFKENYDTIVIASGKNFPDGLAGGPVACAYEAPLVLVADNFFDHAKGIFTEKGAYRLVVMGGTGVISKDIAEAIADPAKEKE